VSYEAALDKAWEDLEKAAARENYSVKLLGETYALDINARKACLLSTGLAPRDWLTVVLLHYLASSLKKGYSSSGEWISFKEIKGGDIYYPAFRQGVIKEILKKYGDVPERLIVNLAHLGAKESKEGTMAVEFNAFPDVPVKVIVWRGDEEFGPEATILFDKNIEKLFSMEDVAVFSRLIARAL